VGIMKKLIFQDLTPLVILVLEKEMGSGIEI
jgi:hypothetical protein